MSLTIYLQLCDWERLVVAARETGWLDVEPAEEDFSVETCDFEKYQRMNSDFESRLHSENIVRAFDPEDESVSLSFSRLDMWWGTFFSRDPSVMTEAEREEWIHSDAKLEHPLGLPRDLSADFRRCYDRMCQLKDDLFPADWTNATFDEAEFCGGISPENCRLIAEKEEVTSIEEIRRYLGDEMFQAQAVRGDCWDERGKGSPMEGTMMFLSYSYRGFIAQCKRAAESGSGLLYGMCY